MKTILLIAMFLVHGCGSSDTADSQQPPAVSKFSSADEIGISAKLIASGQPYPTCDTVAKGDLIYVQDEALFYFCDEHLGWLTVDLKGGNGRDGLNGRDGRDGSAGKEGKDGKDAPYVGAKEWIHPITGEKWFLGRLIPNGAYAINDGSPTGAFTEENFICPMGSHSPDAEEMKSAYYSGAMTIFLPFVTGLGTGYLDGHFIVGLRERVAEDTTFYDKILMNKEGQSQDQWNIGGYTICVIGQ